MRGWAFVTDGRHAAAMELLLVRHAIAEEAERPGRSADARRALTPAGKRRMKEGAAGLRELVPGVALVATSPLVRAVETARILAEAYHARIEEVDALAPGSGPEPLLAWLRATKRGPMALVGHEPALSALAGLLVVGRRASIFTFKKGGACLLQLESVQPGGARLEWLATARTLRMLGGNHAR